MGELNCVCRVFLFVRHGSLYIPHPPCRYTGRVAAAAEQFTQALTLDPLLWAAYEELCILGWCIRHP